MSYRALLNQPAILHWILATIGSRLAVTTVPLACVLLAVAQRNNFAVGGILAGSYAFGEAIFAPFMSRRLHNYSFRCEVIGMLALEALLLSATTGLMMTAQYWWVAIGTVGLAGGLASGVPGGLRTYVSVLAQEQHKQTALSLDVVINQACWLAGPAFATMIVSLLTPVATLPLISAILLLTAIPISRLTNLKREPEPSKTVRRRGLVLTLLVPITASGIIMLNMAALDVALPALFRSVGREPALAGLVLGALALLGIITSAVYGLRSWRGSPSLHSTLATIAMGLLMIVSGLSPSLWLTIALCVLVGVSQAPALIGRNIALTNQLPQHLWPTGFSLLYAAGGIGYTIGGTIAGFFSELFPPSTVFVLTGIIVVTVTGTASILPK